MIISVKQFARECGWHTLRAILALRSSGLAVQNAAEKYDRDYLRLMVSGVYRLSLERKVSFDTIKNRYGLTYRIIRARAREMKVPVFTARVGRRVVSYIRLKDEPRMGFISGKVCLSTACSRYDLPPPLVQRLIRDGTFTVFHWGENKIILLDENQVQSYACEKYHVFDDYDDDDDGLMDFCRIAASYPGHELAPHDKEELERRRRKYEEYCLRVSRGSR